MKDEIKYKIEGLLPKTSICYDEEMSKHTTLKIGGIADCLVMPSTTSEIIGILCIAKEYQIPYYVIGNGSNLLVSDRGFCGIVIKLMKNFSDITFLSDTKVIAKSGTLLSTLAKSVAERGLIGLEFAAGIPGTIGGAVTMNAGAYGGEIKDSIVCATVLTEDGQVISLTKDELELGYRKSMIQKKKYFVLDATFELSPGDRIFIKEKMNEYAKQRREKQPLEFPSAGSTFKRPEGYFAGKLIMDAGLRGYRVGDAGVSEKHCGFVVNYGRATATEFYQVIIDVQRIVLEKYQVKLEPEVKLLGEFNEG